MKLKREKQAEKWQIWLLLVFLPLFLSEIYLNVCVAKKIFVNLHKIKNAINTNHLNVRSRQNY